MRRILLLTCTVVMSVLAIGQAPGDYQSFTSGNWNAASTWLRYNGTSFVPAPGAPSSSDGVISILNGHTVTVNSTVTIDETVVDAGGTLVQTSDLTIGNGTGDDITVNGAFTFSSGTLSGAGNMKVNGTMNWQSGSIQSANVLLAAGSVSSKTTTGLADVNNAVLTNNGNFSWTQGNIQLQNFGVFNNGVTGIITATGNDAMTAACCSVSFNNAGTFIKSGGTGTSAINVNGSNQGTIIANEGTISSAGVFANSGTISVASGKTFLVNGGTFSLNTGSNSNGAGNFQFSSGTIAVNAPAATPATATNYLFTAGTMNGSGTLNVTGGMEWQSGSIQLANVQLVAGSVSSKTTAGLADVNNAVLTNNGNFSWTQGNIQLQNFGVFNNGVTGIITATGNDAMTPACCSVSFNNAGTFIKSNSPGTTTIGVASSNSGTVKGIGTINLSSSFASDGIIAPGTSPGLLTINGSEPLSANSNLQIEMQNGSGPGTGHDQLIRAGSMTLAGTITVTSTPNVPLGTYTIINLTSGTTSGSFATVNLPPGTSLLINPTNVQLIVNTILPLKLISFTGSKQNNDALLQWKTANETGVSKFEVQRSDNGQTFTSIGTVASGAALYSFTDANTFSSRMLTYYRLKSIDVDARFTYSNILRLSKQANTALTVYPNPVSNLLTISGLKEKGTILLFNADGKLLRQQIVSAQTMSMDMSNYAKGIYLLQYTAEDEVVNQEIIKQ
jgi:Secretion system C-terminal sorting domain